MRQSCMKTFSNFDRKVIDKILNLYENNSVVCLANILADESGILGKPTEFDFSSSGGNQFAVFYFKNLDTSKAEDRKFLKTKKQELYSIVLLLEYLEEKGYVVTTEGGAKPNPSANSTHPQNIPLTTDLEKRLCKLWDKEIQVCYSLKELKDHKYMEQSVYEARHYTKWYIILTVIMALISVFEILTTSKVIIESVEKTVPVQIEKTNSEVAK